MRRPYSTKNSITNLTFGLFSINAARLVITTLALSFASTSNAAWKNSADEAPEYVDSIHKWGAWELDIEPAAGGLQQPASQALKARDSKVSLRTNSVSALAPQRPAIPAIPAAPPGATPPVIVTLP